MYDIKKIYEPKDIDEAVKFLAEDDEAIVINGGSDVLIKNREGQLTNIPFVSIYNLKELKDIYIDDKDELPQDQQMKIDMGNGQMKKIKTIGDRWSMFQQINFENNSQPHYVLVTPDNKVINTPVSGYMDKEDFKKFLECGLKHYKNHKK